MSCVTYCRCLFHLFRQPTLNPVILNELSPIENMFRRKLQIVPQDLILRSKEMEIMKPQFSEQRCVKTRNFHSGEAHWVRDFRNSRSRYVSETFIYEVKAEEIIWTRHSNHIKRRDCKNIVATQDLENLPKIY